MLHVTSRFTLALALSLALTLLTLIFLIGQPAQAAIPPAQGGCPAGGIAYVNQAAITGTQTGADWPNALLRLQDALALKASCGITRIWVAKGVYTPSIDPTYRTATFLLDNRLEIYGGFAGTETLLSQRDFTANPTILSGDLLGDDGPNFANNTDNSYHVVVSIAVNSSAVLDGFTITAGNANSSSGCLHSCGGGMFNTLNSNPILRNLTFSSNSAILGGGMYNNDGSSPSLTNITFTGNTAIGSITGSSDSFSKGGGMYNTLDSSPSLVNVTFSNNTAILGGGMFNTFGSNPSLTNVIFSGNSAGGGGGIYNASSSTPSLTNVIFSGNSALFGGGGMYNSISSPQIRNSLLWGNSAPSGPQIYNTSSTPLISYSLIQDSGDSGSGWDSSLGTDGGHNLDADPLFVAPIAASSAPTSTGNYRLQFGSPAIDAGSNSLNPTSTDRNGQPRIQSDTIDLGAYESAFSSQEIALLGNGLTISNGDTSPSPTDHTDFGSVILGQAITRTFTISNSGDVNLLLTGSPIVSITGPAAADFSLVALPATPVLSQTTTTFQVRFSSNVVGTRAATLTIANNDSDENPYSFAVQGNGGLIATFLPVVIKN